MRGYKVIWSNISALCYNFQYCEDLGNKLAILWPVVEMLKIRCGVADYYIISIAGTPCSGIIFFR